MPNSIRLILALHNHQPIGNFDHVFQNAYADSYLPFLEIFSRYDLPLALHTSGSLMEWLDAAHPEYVDRLAELAAAGRLEILGPGDPRRGPLRAHPGHDPHPRPHRPDPRL
jgi:alpha-amylase